LEHGKLQAELEVIEPFYEEWKKEKQTFNDKLQEPQLQDQEMRRLKDQVQRMSEIDKDISEKREELSTVKNENAGLKANVGNLEGEVSSTSQSMKSAGDEIKTLQSVSNEHHGCAVTIQGIKATLEQRDAAVTKKDEELKQAQQALTDMTTAEETACYELRTKESAYEELSRRCQVMVDENQTTQQATRQGQQAILDLSNAKNRT
jgi:chromosome segregation ATPase